MSKKFEKVYQFKITLKGIKPSIWRRIQVPQINSFWDLHVAIQNAFGWLDSHLHNFEIRNPQTGLIEEIGIPDEEGWSDIEIIPEWGRKISRYFTEKNKNARYVYDYGDNWEPNIKLEQILSRDPKSKYPICIGGKRACPPEDCGGVPGYEDFLEIIMNPNHESYEEMMEWIGGHFDSEHFDSDEVVFDDPEKRRKYAF